MSLSTRSIAGDIALSTRLGELQSRAWRAVDSRRMGLVDLALGPLRSVLGSVEQEAEEHVEQVLPVAEIAGIQEQILDGMNALRRAAESIEAHVAVVDQLGDALPPMTEAVTQLSARLGELMEVLAPIAAMERDIERAERDVTRATHFFRRRPRQPGEAVDSPPVTGD